MEKGTNCNSKLSYFGAVVVVIVVLVASIFGIVGAIRKSTALKDCTQYELIYFSDEDEREVAYTGRYGGRVFYQTEYVKEFKWEIDGVYHGYVITSFAEIPNVMTVRMNPDNYDCWLCSDDNPDFPINVTIRKINENDHWDWGYLTH